MFRGSELFGPTCSAASGHLFEPIVVVEPAEDGNPHDTDIRRKAMPVRLQLHRATDRLRDTGSEAGVRAGGVVVIDVLREDEAQVVLREGDEVVASVPGFSPLPERLSARW
jgi:hypothetical protein